MMNIYRTGERLKIRLRRLQKRTLSAIWFKWKRFHRITVSRADYGKLRLDQDFVASLQLSRLVNIIRATQRNYLRVPDNGNLANTRDTIEYQYFYSAVVYESVKSLLDLGGKLKHLHAWQANSQITKELNRERNSPNSYFVRVLGAIRNTVMFHFDSDAVTSALELFQVKERIDLMVSQSRLNKDLVTPLAEDLVLNYVLAQDERTISGSQKYDEWPRYVTEMSNKVITVANACILEIWTKHAHKSFERLDV